MHHRMPLPNSWVAQFKRGDFSICHAPRPWRHKTLTTPEIIDQINELILEDGRISAKSIAEQLGISRERVWSIIYKDLNVRKLSAKCVLKCLNVDQKRRCHRLRNVWNFFGAIQMISCRARLVTMDETWLYHYDPETKQQSTEWQYSGSSAPKNSECKNPLEKFSPRFFGIKTASSSLIIFQRTKHQRGVLLISSDAIEGLLEGKSPRVVHQGGLVLARQFPGSPGTYNPEETGLPGLPKSWSPTLFSISGPVGLPSVPWTEKTIERSPFFIRSGGHCCRGDLVERTTFWTFFEWLANVRATG